MHSIIDKSIIFYTFLNLFCHKDAKTPRYSLLIIILGVTSYLCALGATILKNEEDESNIWQNLTPDYRRRNL
jgi:hypothetical protein